MKLVFIVSSIGEAMESSEKTNVKGKSGTGMSEANEDKERPLTEVASQKFSFKHF